MSLTKQEMRLVMERGLKKGIGSVGNYFVQWDGQARN